MDTEDAAIDDGSECKVVKDFAAPTPDVTAPVLALTLVVKTVYLGDLSRLVVAADEGDSLGIPDLESQQKKKRFNAVKAPINKVS